MIPVHNHNSMYSMEKTPSCPCALPDLDESRAPGFGPVGTLVKARPSGVGIGYILIRSGKSTKEQPPDMKLEERGRVLTTKMTRHKCSSTHIFLYCLYHICEV